MAMMKPIDYIMAGIERQQIEQEGVYGLYQRGNAYISGTLKPIYEEYNRTKQDYEKTKENLEVLAGTRSRNATGRAAVRYEDLRVFERFPSRPPNYKYLGAAPSADDYNKLAADVKKLYEVIGALASILATKL